MAGAEGLFREAIPVWEKLSPDGMDLAICLDNLANVAADRGDLAGAEAMYLRALPIWESVAPDSLDLAICLHNLGAIEEDRRDLEAAEKYHRRALAIREAQAPGTLDVAASLSNLGVVAQAKGDTASAERFFTAAHEIHEKLAPSSLLVAHSFRNLALAAQEKGDVGQARSTFNKALAIQEKLAPGSLAAAATLQSLGDLELAAGELRSAQGLLEKSLSIRRELAPGSALEARSYHSSGVLSRRLGDKENALECFLRAVDSLEAQGGRLGGTEEAKARFAAAHVEFYRDLVEILVELGRAGEALHAMERSRARSFLAMLAERDLIFAADVPAALDREQRMIEAELYRLQSALGEAATDGEPEGGDVAVERIGELHRRRSQIKGEIKRISPRLASLKYPEPLNLEGMRSALEPGVLYLSYCIGERASFLFSIGPGTADFSVERLAVTRGDLAREVRRFREAILAKDDVRDAASSLSGKLLPIPRRKLEDARLILVSPDGPLHFLPFHALGEPGSQRKRFRFLAESKAVCTVLSATVYSELKGGGRRGGDGLLIAFGDPVYARDGEPGGTPSFRWLTQGEKLPPLPATRAEVERICGLYPGSRSYLAGDAREEEARGLGKDASRIHFACHGFYDERFPLDSGLALSLPEKIEERGDNGLWQAWEIFEQLRIDADLVTLSACETGLGKEMGGEGLIGLTRAFQYAGARSVLSSLWNVSDESTAELMKSFYSHLKEGKPKAEALRLAQLELIHPSPNSKFKIHNSKLPFSHPFYWAGFVLNGDWK